MDLALAKGLQLPPFKTCHRILLAAVVWPWSKTAQQLANQLVTPTHQVQRTGA